MSLFASPKSSRIISGDGDREKNLHVCITGTSRGIGLAAARILIGQGHTVYHACRTMERAQLAADAAGGGVPMECDLSSFDSIRDFAAKLRDEAPQLDVLCLNAGVAPFSAARTPRLTKDGYEECIGVNHLGHFLLTNLLYDKLKADGGGRLVVTASSVHDPNGPGGASNGCCATVGDVSGLGVNLSANPSGAVMIDGALEYDGAKCYKDSKLCNILFCREAVTRFPGVVSYSFTPGFIPTTGLFQPLRDHEWWKAQMLTIFAKLAGFSVSEDVGGRRLAYMATMTATAEATGDGSPPTPSSSSGASPSTGIPLNGSYFSAPSKSTAATMNEGFQPTDVSNEALNRELATKLWERSLDVVKGWM